MILTYENIINFSTANFHKRHLIIDQNKRIRLLKKCNELMRSSQKWDFEYNQRDLFSQIVYDSCGYFACERFDTLVNYGYFMTGSGNTYTNTIILQYDSNGTILLHVSQGYTRDLRFKLEQKSSLDGKNHLGWKNGKIFHFGGYQI